MDLGLTGKVALVTGASAGLGYAIARELSQEGALVAIVGRRADLVKAKAEELSRETGRKVVAIPGDVGQAGEAQRIVKAANDALGPVDILLANAGGPPATAVETTTDEQFVAAINQNLLGSIRLAYACLPSMRQRKWGRIIFLTSYVAKMPLSSLVLSNTARAGIFGFSKTLSNAVAKDHVLVNIVMPGHFDTQRAIDLAKMRAEREGKPVEDMLKSRTLDTPMGRAGDPKEFAAVVTFLASERASYVTGTAIQVDGGNVSTIL